MSGFSAFLIQTEGGMILICRQVWVMIAKQGFEWCVLFLSDSIFAIPTQLHSAILSLELEIEFVVHRPLELRSEGDSLGMSFWPSG